MTPPNNIPFELELVNDLFANGLQRLHLRKDHVELNEYNNYLNGVNKIYHGQISVHEHFDVLDTFASLGIHLKSHQRNNTSLMNRVLKRNPASLSSSFHSWKEIEENGHPFDYVFISPVFDSISKQGYKAAIDLPEAKNIKQKLAANGKPCPSVIALGGVDVSNLEALHQHGFDGAAVMGAIWKSPDPLASFQQIMKMIKQLERA